MLTRSRRRQGQISSEQEGRDVTDEAPSVDGEGTEEPTAMNDGGDANASGSRSSNLSPLTGSETSEEAAIDGGSELLVQQYDDGGTGTPHARRALPDVARAARASPGAARNAVDAADRWRRLRQRVRISRDLASCATARRSATGIPNKLFLSRHPVQRMQPERDPLTYFHLAFFLCFFLGCNFLGYKRERLSR